MFMLGYKIKKISKFANMLDVFEWFNNNSANKKKRELQLMISKRNIIGGEGEGEIVFRNRSLKNENVTV